VEQQHRRRESVGISREIHGIQNRPSVRRNIKQEPLQRISAKCTVVTVGSAALSNSALFYTRIVGANDGVSREHMGVGNRGTELDGMVARLKEQKNVR
jgi:hypothetical protein